MLSKPSDGSAIGSKGRKDPLAASTAEFVREHFSSPSALTISLKKSRLVKIPYSHPCLCHDCEKDPEKRSPSNYSCRSGKEITLEAWCDNCQFCDAFSCTLHNDQCKMLKVGMLYDCDCYDNGHGDPQACPTCMCFECDSHRISEDDPCCESESEAASE